MINNMTTDIKKIRLCAFADEASQSVKGQISALHRNGIELLEVRGINGVNISKLSDSAAREAAEAFRADGIRIWSIGSPIGKSSIDEASEIQLEMLKRIAELADIFETKNIRIFSFYDTDGISALKETVIERLGELAETAKSCGVTLCHENEKGIWGENSENCREIHKALPEIKCVFDPANFVQCGVDVQDAWKKLRQYVYYGHIKDALSDGMVVPPGMGEGHLADYLPEYVGMASDVLTIEPHLAEFCGLKGLEKSHRSILQNNVRFADNNEAFDFACDIFKKLLDRLQIKY